METDRRELLEAAFDKLEGDDEPGKVEVTNEGNEKPDLQKPEKELAAKGGEKDDKQSPPSETATKETKKDDEYTRASKASEDKSAAPVVTDKAPLSWKPAAKEVWAKLPAEARAEISRREKEMSQYISSNDHHKRFSDQFSQVVKPFQHLIQAQNSTPLQAVHNLMTTAAGLAQGNKTQKAQIVAEIIGNYDVDIQTLDLILSGKGGEIKRQPQDDYNPRMMQMLQPLYGFMNEIKQARDGYEKRRQEEADVMVSQFDKPYFEDVREDMADIIEMASRRGVEMSLDQAYEKALSLNPEISAIVAREKQAEEAKAAGTRLAKARKVASTIVGNPSGHPDGRAQPKSRKEQLEQAWEDRTH